MTQRTSFRVTFKFISRAKWSDALRAQVTIGVFSVG